MQTKPDNHITTDLILSKFKEQFRISGKDSVDLLVAFTNFLKWFDFPVEPLSVAIKTNPPKYGRVEFDLFVDKKKMHWLPFQCEHHINNKIVGVLRKYIQVLNEMHSNGMLDIDKLFSWWEDRYYIQTPYFEWTEPSTREFFINTPPQYTTIFH